MSEIKKPVITKEQADSIEAFLEVGTKEELLTAKVHCCHFGDEYSGINTIDIMTLAAALINGYEVDKTPEEKVREYYEDLCDEFDRAYWSSDELKYLCKKQAVRETLDKLGIKIEGVNA
ncbi:hypothetical protein MOB72_08120 [Bacillus licheniformis]|uniref:hypothetical protein n=1 Tax=Bacillus licheniformis TaxID=1402 RepID=UPI000928A02D|nr:hypothetical protein [Bacillus licheniformis]MCY7954718.1 hypothetical protein [Bacillus licheniformis]MCY9220550.1 hypothetical protein [Bacillus licheniformis]OJT67884.1 hypothetical protein BFP46_15385 [Bacillus licheniformis]